ncbi:MAG TPA: phosphatidate cytidylyltransferase, partial [Chloroflexota bacterium]|nr:phosphatidate cytidylyltransferase [Chloroflexota bacterium]
LLTQDVRSGTRHLAFAALGFGYLALMLGHVLLLYRHIPGGPGILLALGLAIALSDIGAFVTGRLFGRRKLAPILSPNKTWAGLAGNVLGAFAGLALMGFALPGEWPHGPGGPGLLLATLPLVVALGAVWGDLLESLIKREFGVKDTAAWLPGMGGLLDRIDSLIVVAPLAYYYLRLLAWVTGSE